LPTARWLPNRPNGKLGTFRFQGSFCNSTATLGDEIGGRGPPPHFHNRTRPRPPSVGSRPMWRSCRKFSRTQNRVFPLCYACRTSTRKFAMQRRSRCTPQDLRYNRSRIQCSSTSTNRSRIQRYVACESIAFCSRTRADIRRKTGPPSTPPHSRCPDTTLLLAQLLGSLGRPGVLPYVELSVRLRPL